MLHLGLSRLRLCAPESLRLRFLPSTQARLPRRTGERAGMIRWLKEMLLLTILLVP